MDSVNRSFSLHARLVPSLFNIEPQNRLAALVLQQVSPRDKPILRNIASTNRQINVLATPLLLEAYIDHAENKVKTMKTSAERGAAIFQIQRKLSENADKLPVSVCVTFWERMKVLVVGEIKCLASLYELHEETDTTTSPSQTKGIPIQYVMTLQTLTGLLHEISKILTKPLDDFHEQLRRAAMNS